MGTPSEMGRFPPPRQGVVSELVFGETSGWNGLQRNPQLELLKIFLAKSLNYIVPGVGYGSPCRHLHALICEQDSHSRWQ